jgi:hypothetical protein
LLHRVFNVFANILKEGEFMRITSRLSTIWVGAHSASIVACRGGGQTASRVTTRNAITNWMKTQLQAWHVELDDLRAAINAADPGTRCHLQAQFAQLSHQWWLLWNQFNANREADNAPLKAEVDMLLRRDAARRRRPPYPSSHM